MPGTYNYQHTNNGILKTGVDAGLIASGSVTFTASESKTTEKKTTDIVLTEPIHPDGVFLLAIQKPTFNAVGNLTVNTYNVIKIDNTNAVDVLHTSHTVEMITGNPTYRNFLIQGLFVGEGKIKLGFVFTTNDTTAGITIHYKLYRL